MFDRANNLLFVLTIGALFLSGCGKQVVLKTVLDADEAVQPKDAVYVDGNPAGVVRAVRLEGGLRLAEFAIKDEAAQEKMRAGVLREPGAQRINLTTGEVKPGAAPLPEGQIISRQSKIEYAAKKYAFNQTTLIVVGGVLAAVLLALILKKVFKSAVVLALALPLAGATAWVVTPNVVPIVERFYASAPVKENVSSAAPADKQPLPNVMAKTKELEGKLVQILDHRPDPRAVSFSMVFLLGFVCFACLVGGVIRLCTGG